jgi:single-strand DNA-binding protein
MSMTDFNHVVLIGRLTRDAELRYTASNMAVCKFSIANNQRRKKDNAWVDEAHFFDVTLWGKTAESLHKYLVKGKQVAVEGQLRRDRWEKDGQARSKVEINANNIQLLGGSGPSGAAPRGAGGPTQEPSYDQPPPEGGGGESFEDDIPF